MTAEVKTVVVDTFWDQPQGLCDLIGIAFRIWRVNLRLVFKAILGPTIIMLLGLTAVQLCFYFAGSIAADSAKASGVQGLVLPMAMMGVGSLLSIVYLAGLVIVFVRELALTRLICGFSPDWQTAYKFCSRPSRVGWVVALGALTWIGMVAEMLCVFVGMFISAMLVGAVTAAFPGNPIPAVLVGIVLMGGTGVLGLAGFGLGCLVSWLGLAVLAFEDTTVFDALSRVMEMFKANFGRTALFGGVLMVVMGTVHTCFSLPSIIITVADLFARGATGLSAGNSQPSLYVVIFNQVWESLTNMMLRPVTIFACGLIYLDHCQRLHGTDIARRIMVMREKLLAERGEPA